MDDIKKFSQAVLQGIQSAQASGSAGLSGVADSINKGFANRMNAALYSGGGIGAVASQKGKELDEADEAARQARIASLKNKLDPGKYQRIRKEDGGFKFLDPDGVEIGIDRYSAVTGMRPAEILKDSDNPIDRQFVNDYQNMNSIMEAAFNGDEATVRSALEANGYNTSLKPEAFMQKLIEKYPHIYGVGSYKVSRSNLNKPVFKMPSGGGNAYGVSLPGSFGG